MATSQALSEILQSVTSSKLNYSVNLTPYSAYITIRKSFIKNFTPPGNYQEVSTVTEDLKVENAELKRGMKELVVQINNLNFETKASTFLKRKFRNLKQLHSKYLKKGVMRLSP
jgi:hypothetical protein